MSSVMVGRHNDDSRNRSMATNFAQRSLERIRTEAQVNYDGLTTANIAVLFATDPQELDTASRFPGFTRQAVITPVDGSTEFKKIDLEIQWIDRGETRSYRFAAFLARPADPFPGNIHGTVTDAITHNPVPGAAVTIRFAASPALSLSTNTNAQGEYTFSDASTGAYCVKPGSWAVTAVCAGYTDYTHGVTVNVGSNEDVDVDFAMQPKPDHAHIRGTVRDTITGASLRQYVSLYRNGVFVACNSAGQMNSGQFDFQIDFSVVEQRCYTLITSNQSTESSYPYIANQHCGDFQDCWGWGRSYNYRGWSSAVVREDGSIQCGNPWAGSSAAGVDRICVNPGNDIIVPITLAPIPTATMSGRVYAASGSPVQGQIRVDWHPASGSRFWGFYTTAADGSYSIPVPAEQELFPSSSAYYLRTYAYGSTPRTCCCNDACAQTVYSPTYTVGPVAEGQNVTQNFTLSAGADLTCGNASGIVNNARTGAGLDGVQVSIYGSRVTNGSGQYQFICPDTGKSIPQGSYWVYASKTGYYSFTSQGNTWYTARGVIQIIANADITYPSFKLLSIGKGTIHGRVVEAGVNLPVPSVQVNLDAYDNAYDKTVTTGADGRFVFSQIIESWPPAAVAGDPYFVQTARTHSITVPESAQYFAGGVNAVTLNDGETKDVGDIVISHKGSM